MSFQNICFGTFHLRDDFAVVFSKLSVGAEHSAYQFWPVCRKAKPRPCFQYPYRTQDQKALVAARALFYIGAAAVKPIFNNGLRC